MGAHTNDITITVYRGTDPVLITGDPAVIGAVRRALAAAIRDGTTPRSRAALRLIGESSDEGRGDDGRAE